MMVWLLVCSLAMAQDPKDILEAAVKKQRITNSIQQIDMTLIAKNGGKQNRSFSVSIRKDKDAVRSYTRFTHPVEIANTQLIVVDRPQKTDPQLLYIPALKRVQRISGRSTKGSFMGSDFSYADLEFTLDKSATHKLIQETDQIWQIETTSPNHSLYSRWISSIRKDNYIPEQIEYFDRKGKKLKTLFIQKTKLQGKTVIPILTKVTNHQRGSQTLLEIKSIETDVPASKLPLSMFTAGYMKQNE